MQHRVGKAEEEERREEEKRRGEKRREEKTREEDEVQRWEVEDGVEGCKVAARYGMIGRVG